MDTALYYTLSTISQTLAAGFAVLAAFVLYRLQSMEYELSKSNEVFSRFHDYISLKEIWRYILEEDYDVLDKRMREIEKECNISFYSPDTLKPPFEQVLFWWPIWKTTTLWLRVALAFTVVDIAICFSALPFVPLMATNSCVYISVLAIAVVIGICAVLLYARLIFLLLSPAKLGPPKD
jgi:hypothetical protein